MTKVTHAEQLQLDTPANLWAYFGTTGVNITVFYDAAGKFGIGGAATMGGAVAVPALTIDPNSGLTTLLGGGDLNGQKITSLANGTNPTDAINLSQLTGAIGGSISGTPNRVAKFTAANAVGDTAFPIDDAANALTLGNNQALDVVTVNGRLALTATDGATDSLHSTMSATNVTTATIAAIKGDNASTFDTTAGPLQSTTACFANTSTRSAGASVLTNVALTATASGAQDNIALKTELGDVRLNRTGGNALIGATLAASAIEPTNALFAGATPKLEVVTGQAVGTYTELVTVRHPSADVSAVTRRLGLVLKLSDESNATESNKSGGLVLESSSTFANTPTLSLTTAGSKRVDITSAGAVTINAPTSGTALAVTGTDSTTNAILATWTPVAGTTSQLATVRGNASGTFDTTATALTVIAVRGTNTSTRSAGANDVNNVGVLGEASGGQNNKGVNASSTGTGTTNWGLFASSTGAGTTNFGVDTTATGATNNIALRTVSGDNYLNTTGGNTAIGLASGAAFTDKLRISSSSGTAYAAQFVRSTAGGTTTALGAFLATDNGTYDTTAGVVEARAINGAAVGSISAGANVLRNIGGLFNAINGTTNIAIRTLNGDVQLNNTSGVTTVGFSNATTNALLVSGSAQLTSSVSAQNGFLATWTPVGGTTSALGAVRGLSNGTLDTTGGAIGAAAVTGTITATKSAGGSGLTNYGVRGIASGSVDNNYGIRGETAATGTANVGAYGQATGAGTTNWGGRFTATGAGTNIALQTDSGSVLLNNTAGTTTIGFSSTTTSALVVSGQQANTFTGLAASANTFTWTPVASTSDALSSVRVQGTGTFDTTAGVLLNYGVNANVTSSRSAGANALTNIAIRGNASGAQTNIALQTDIGSNYLNATSGSTGVGIASGGTLTTKFNVTGTSLTAGVGLFTWTPVASTTSAIGAVTANSNGTFDTTAGVLGNTAMVASNSATRSAGANNLTNKALVATASGAQVNIALETQAGDNYLNTTSGSTGIGYASAAALAAKLSATSSGLTFSATSTSGTTNTSSITWTSVASTSSGLSALVTTTNGTFDTTAGALQSRAVTLLNSSTKSAGGNTLTKYALVATNTGAADTSIAGYFDAQGGTANVAIQTSAGSNYLNTASGSSGFGYALGAALPAKLSVTGGITLTTDLTIGGALAHQGTTVGFYNTAPVVRPTPAGSRGGNAALASLLTALAGQGLIIDGTTA